MPTWTVQRDEIATKVYNIHNERIGYVLDNAPGNTHRLMKWCVVVNDTETSFRTRRHAEVALLTKLGLVQS